MTAITIERTAIPIIKTSLEQRQKILELKLLNYHKRLKEFEKKHRISTSKFLKNFHSGKLGDDAYLIEWEFLAEVTEELAKQLEQMRKIKL